MFHAFFFDGADEECTTPDELFAVADELFAEADEFFAAPDEFFAAFRLSIYFRWSSAEERAYQCEQ